MQAKIKKELKIAINEYITYAKVKKFSELKHIYLKIHNLYEQLDSSGKEEFKGLIEQVERHVGKREGGDESKQDYIFTKQNKLLDGWLKNKVFLGLILLIILVIIVFIFYSFRDYDSYQIVENIASVETIGGSIKVNNKVDDLRIIENLDNLFLSQLNMYFLFDDLNKKMGDNIYSIQFETDDNITFITINRSPQYLAWSAYGLVGLYRFYNDELIFKKLQLVTNEYKHQCNIQANICLNLFEECKKNSYSSPDCKYIVNERQSEAFQNFMQEIISTGGVCQFTQKQMFEVYETLDDPTLFETLYNVSLCQYYLGFYPSQNDVMLSSTKAYEYLKAYQLFNFSWFVMDAEVRLQRMPKLSELAPMNDTSNSEIFENYFCYLGLAYLEQYKLNSYNFTNIKYIFDVVVNSKNLLKSPLPLYLIDPCFHLVSNLKQFNWSEIDQRKLNETITFYIDYIYTFYYTAEYNHIEGFKDGNIITDYPNVVFLEYNGNYYRKNGVSVEPLGYLSWILGEHVNLKNEKGGVS